MSTVDVRHVRRVMFVCLGNICRSPIAQGAFEHRARERGVIEQLTIASCGTGDWHIGSLPDHRSRAVAAKHGLTLTSRAQLFHPSHVTANDLFVAMDRSNVSTLVDRGVPASRIRLFLEFAPRVELLNKHPAAALGLEIPDPYHGGGREFEEVFSMCDMSARGLLGAMFEGA